MSWKPWHTKCPECGYTVLVQEFRHTQLCDSCGVEFDFPEDDDDYRDPREERDAYADAKLHAMRDGD